MGVALSADARRPKPFKLVQKAAGRFRLDDVLAARARFAETYRETGSILIGRRHFHDVFTDYSLETVYKGKFLDLPLDVFKLFEHEDSGIADVREIFCVLSFLCKQGSLSTKLEVVFPLFGKSMTEERVQQFLAASQRAFFRIGLLETKAPASAVQAMGARICGEGAWRKCSTISSQLLGDWLANFAEVQPIVSRILSDKERRAIEQYSMLADPSELKAKTSLMKREAKKLLAASQSAPAVRGGRSSATTKNDNAAKAKSLVSLQSASNGQNRFDETAVTELSPQSLSALRACWEKYKTSRKGLSKEQFSDVMSAQFPNVTSPAIIARMFVVFDKNRDGMVDYDEFMIGVTQMASTQLEDKVRFLFEVANAERRESGAAPNGKTLVAARRPSGSSPGFDGQKPESSDTTACAAAAAVALTPGGNGSDEEPVMRLFDLVKLVQDNNQEMVEAAQYVEILITMMDYDKNGVVDRGEFLRACSEMPSILDSFEECLKPSSETRRAVKELANNFKPFTVDNIIKTWIGLGPRRVHFKRVSWTSFLEFIDPIWAGTGSSPKKSCSHFDAPVPIKPRSPTPKNGCGPDPVDDIIYNQLARLFKSGDPVKNSQTGVPDVDLRKLVVGMVSSLDGSSGKQALCIDSPSAVDPTFQEKKALLYFELFDLDFSGEVDYHEFFEMLYTSQMDAQDEAWKAVESLRRLDLNGDGLVTYSEFMEVVKNDVVILHCFGRIFNASTDDEAQLEDEIEQKTVPADRTNLQDGFVASTPINETSPEANDTSANAQCDEPNVDSLKIQTDNQCDSSDMTRESARSTTSQSKVPQTDNMSDDKNNNNTSGIDNNGAGTVSLELSPRLLLSASMPELPINSVYRTTYYFKSPSKKPAPIFRAETETEMSPLPSPKSPTTRKPQLEPLAS